MPKRGGSRGRKKASLYDLSKEHVKPEHQEEYLKELGGESDRAAALVAAAEVESYLVYLLMPEFKRLSADEKEALFFGRRAPLSEFAARIAVAYGLGLLEQSERDDLDRIRRIRNAFAHTVIPVKFTTEVIAAECAKLHYYDVFNHVEFTDADEVSHPKSRYIITALALRKIFGDRVLSRMKERAKSYPKDQRKRFLAQIDEIVKQHKPKPLPRRAAARNPPGSRNPR
jgi:hypothetical protein